MNTVTVYYCPTFASNICHDWPDSRDLTFPRLVFFSLSVLSPSNAQSVFEDVLLSVYVVAPIFFTANSKFWHALNIASARCLAMGIHVEHFQIL